MILAGCVLASFLFLRVPMQRAWSPKAHMAAMLVQCMCSTSLCSASAPVQYQSLMHLTVVPAAPCTPIGLQGAGHTVVCAHSLPGSSADNLWCAGIGSRVKAQLA